MLGELLRVPIAAINHNPLLSLAVLILAGYLFGRLCQVLRLPTITGYIVAGLVLSHSISGVVDRETVEGLTPITEVALSLIALTIGSEFQLAKLRRTGTKILAITVFESLFARRHHTYPHSWIRRGLVCPAHAHMAPKHAPDKR